MNLVEVMLSLGLLGVACGWYGTIFRSASVDREASERFVIAMELAREQVDFLRRQTETDMRPPPAGVFLPPFREDDAQFPNPLAERMACPPFQYRASVGRTNNLQPPVGTKSPEISSCFYGTAAAPAFAFPAGHRWLVRAAPPFGPATLPGGAPLVPRDVAEKGWSVDVRASRVRQGANQNYESQLIHYQVMVRRDGAPVLMVPFVKRMVFAGG